MNLSTQLGLFTIGLITGFTAYKTIEGSIRRETLAKSIPAVFGITTFLFANPLAIPIIKPEGAAWVAGHWAGASTALLCNRLTRR